MLENPMERLPKQGAQCAEFLEAPNPKIRETVPPRGDTNELPSPENGWAWTRLSNPGAIIATIRTGGLGLMGFGVVAVLFAAISDVEPTSWEYLYLMTPGLGIAALAHVILKVGKRYIWKWGNTLFLRESGYVCNYGLTGKRCAAFTDLSAQFDRRMGSDTHFGVRLRMKNAAGDVCVSSTLSRQGVGTVATPCIDWEFLQQYMDSNQPLPDVPEFESARDQDPVTREADRRRGRPKNFWRNISHEQKIALFEASTLAARAYPFPLKRSEAKAEGWQPSIFSALQLEEISYETFLERLNKVKPE